MLFDPARFAAVVTAADKAGLIVHVHAIGDNAVTEGWAMLLEHLTIDPVWLERRLDFENDATLVELRTISLASLRMASASRRSARP